MKALVLALAIALAVKLAGCTLVQNRPRLAVWRLLYR